MILLTFEMEAEGKILEDADRLDKLCDSKEGSVVGMRAHSGTSGYHRENSELF